MDMPTLAKAPCLDGLSQLFVLKNLLDETTALEYQQHALINQRSFLQYIVENKIFLAENLAIIIAEHFSLPFMDLDYIDFDLIPTKLIHEKLIRRYCVLPLFIRNNHLFLATDDPTQQDIFKEIQFHINRPITIIVVETHKLSIFIERVLNQQENQHLLDYLDSHKLDRLEQDKEHLDPTYSANDDVPIVKFINQLLLDAIRQNASDIHFEPFDKNYRIRYRLDGLLIEIATPSVHLSHRINTRIKVLSNLDITEQRKPQDGRFQLKLSPNHAIDFRVSTCPTVRGEKMVVRIMNTDLTRLDIEHLGFDNTQKQYFLNALTKPQGLILVTGPTGSGKTMSLYTALSLLNSKERNITAAEDPVEIKLSGINQVNVNAKIGLTFSTLLRTFLRQDPDVIMIGEIRDSETAEIAIKAAQTGHLVLSTLHTNNAAKTITRLVNLGIAPFDLADSLNLLVAQRLARRLCEDCKQPRTCPLDSHLVALGFKQEDIINWALYKPIGCKQCINGYRGRIGLFEVMPISKRIKELIMLGTNTSDILMQAKEEGMLTLYQSGLEKIKQGLTTLEEINRVIMDD